MIEKSPETLIAEGHTIESFLRDDVVKEAFVRVEKKFYQEFLGATEPAQLQTAQARTKAILALATELRSVVDAGKFSALAQDKTNRR